MESILHAPGAHIKDGVLKVPGDAQITLKPKKPVSTDNISLNASSVTKKVLVLRADTPSESTSSTRAQISNAVFGTNGDPVNLKSQYAECSYNKLTFNPVSSLNGINIANGVGEVTLSSTVTTMDRYGAMNAMLGAANAKYGNLETLVDNGSLDYVMLCVPPGTAGSWIAYAYPNSWLSVYNNQWCNYVSAQMHEVGHNLGLAHSGETDTYDDKSGMMGYSYSSSDTPKMCFNAAKNWQLGWYPNGKYSIVPLSTGSGQKSFTGHLIGLSEYGSLDTSKNDKVMVQITGYSDDYYVSFNRKSGINSGHTRAGIKY